MKPVSVPDTLIRFGVFEADLRLGELRRNGMRIGLQQLPFRALRLFLSRPGEVIGRVELRQALWPEDVFVDFDRGISSAVNRLRDALGDSAANPIFLETVDRRGYRWIAPTSSLTLEPVGLKPQSKALAEPTAREMEVVPEGARETKPSPGFGRRGRLLAIAALVAAMLAGVGWWSSQSRTHDFAGVSGSRPRRPANAEAEELYLKGRYYWSKRTPDDLNRAVDCFTQAVVHDPGYAQAYAGIADAYNLLREFSAMPPDQAFPRALAAAKKAVALDDRLAEAHTSLAFALYYWNWDRTGAEREYKRAIELSPENAHAHHWYATTLLAERRMPEALREIEMAQTLDPSSAAILADKGLILLGAGRLEESAALLRQVAAANPELASARDYLALYYAALKNYSRSLEESRQAAVLRHSADDLELNEAARKGLAAGGLEGSRRAVLPVQQRLFQTGRGSAYAVAATNELLGRHQEALRFLHEAYRRKEQPMLYLEYDAAVAGLRGNAEFEEILRSTRQARS